MSETEASPTRFKRKHLISFFVLVVTIVIGAFFLTAPREERSPLLDKLEKLSSFHAHHKNFEKGLGETVEYDEFRFTIDEKEIRKLIKENCPSPDWDTDDEFGQLNARNLKTGRIKDIQYMLNVKTVTTWDSSYKSRATVGYKRNRQQMILDYIRSLFDH